MNYEFHCIILIIKYFYYYYNNYIVDKYFLYNI